MRSGMWHKFRLRVRHSVAGSLRLSNRGKVSLAKKAEVKRRSLPAIGSLVSFGAESDSGGSQKLTREQNQEAQVCGNFEA